MRSDVTVADVEAVLAELFKTHPPPWKKIDTVGRAGTEASAGAIVHDRWTSPAVQAALWGLHDLWADGPAEDWEPVIGQTVFHVTDVDFERGWTVAKVAGDVLTVESPIQGNRLEYNKALWRPRPSESPLKVGDRVRQKREDGQPYGATMKVTEVFDDGSVMCEWGGYGTRFTANLLLRASPPASDAPATEEPSVLEQLDRIHQAVTVRHKRLDEMAQTIKLAEERLMMALDPTELTVGSLPLAWAVGGTPRLYAQPETGDWKTWAESTRAAKERAYASLSPFLAGVITLYESKNRGE